MAHLRCAQGMESGSDKESAMRARRQQCGVPAPLSPLDSRADSSSTSEGSNLLALRACSAYPIFSPAGWAEGPSNPPATKRARDLRSCARPFNFVRVAHFAQTVSAARAAKSAITRTTNFQLPTSNSEHGRLRIPADPREMFHFADHAREILFTIDCRPGGIDLMRGCRRRHRDAQFGGFLENQSEVFLHEPQWELR